MYSTIKKPLKQQHSVAQQDNTCVFVCVCVCVFLSVSVFVFVFVHVWVFQQRAQKGNTTSYGLSRKKCLPTLSFVGRIGCKTSFMNEGIKGIKSFLFL